MIDVDGSVALLGAATAFVTAIGVLAKQVRDARRERKARRKTERAVEKVARAAARHSSSVRDVVDELEATGEFSRPTAPPGDGKP